MREVGGHPVVRKAYNFLNLFLVSIPFLLIAISFAFSFTNSISIRIAEFVICTVTAWTYASENSENREKNLEEMDNVRLFTMCFVPPICVMFGAIFAGGGNPSDWDSLSQFIPYLIKEAIIDLTT